MSPTEFFLFHRFSIIDFYRCLLYTSDAADDTPCVDLGGRRIIKKKTKKPHIFTTPLPSGRGVVKIWGLLFFGYSQSFSRIPSKNHLR